MVTLTVGLVLLFIPFILIGLFSDKKKGFIYVLFFLLLFHTILALSTQFLGVFYYWVIVGCTLLANIISIFIYIEIKAKYKKSTLFNFKSIDWIIVIVAAISFLSLYQVHYNYSGGISLTTDNTPSYHEVRNMVYPYPYFSDEWYAVSFVEGAINSHYLPVKNILDNNFFLNLELFFHSFIAQIALILGLDPLLQYTTLSIFLNTLIIILIYLFLRINNISELTAGICSLSALYITCGANLPGLWQLLPFNLGVIFFLLSLCFAEFKSTAMLLSSVLLSSLFYPPLIPFYFIGLIVFLLYRVKVKKERVFKIWSGVFLLLFFAILVYYVAMLSRLAGALNYILSRIFFVSFMAPLVPQINFYDIIPLPAILLAILGLYYLYKNKKWILLSELILGCIFWFFYAITDYRFFAEYERISVFTSIIIVIISGFGLFQLEKYIKSKLKKNGYGILKIVEVATLLIFLVLVPQYTKGDNWKKIIEINPAGGPIVYSKSPANEYLTADDLRIFKNIKDKRFLSVPWKGAVIGVATGNYPVLTKQGTISIGSQNILNNFLQGKCSRKKNLAKSFKLDYVYLYSINCPGFKTIDKSKEGFILYKTDLN